MKKKHSSKYLALVSLWYKKKVTFSESTFGNTFFTVEGLRSPNLVQLSSVRSTVAGHVDQYSSVHVTGSVAAIWPLLLFK